MRSTARADTLTFFAPNLRYSTSGKPAEAVHKFKRMVKALHSAGLEVILDVVYNHTAEGNHLGPTPALRGIDNATYDRLVPEDKRYYLDFTGCGNTLNMQSPQVLQLIMDSLRYWVLEMHVDGFRFDLASALAREVYEVDRLGAFFDIIHQDPVLSQVKLIAEPWDLGAGGYQVGKDIYWLDPSGKEMTDRAWNSPSARSLGVLILGDALEEVDERGRPVRGDTLLILLNAHQLEVKFALPAIGHHTSLDRYTAPNENFVPVVMSRIAVLGAQSAPRRNWLTSQGLPTFTSRLEGYQGQSPWLVRILDTIAAHVEELRYPGGATYPLQGRTLALFVLTAERRTEGAGEPAERRS